MKSTSAHVANDAGYGRLGKRAASEAIGPDEPTASAGFGVATFRPFQAGSATEKLATIIDFIEFCTACHAEGRGFEPRRSRHFPGLSARVPISAIAFQHAPPANGHPVH